MADNKTRRPSFSLLVAGVLGLLVSIWAFIGPHSWPEGLSFGWIVVITAIVVGVLLVISPRKRKE
ncbi:MULTISPECIES: hypothetical protein [unclassified Nocardia]|uniref:hypothetical protein n=1 Tax=unclassified Nocardia TaxID=2637762 RepID=UPI0024A8F936|nr:MULTISPECIES: hypothetical protein [unclassified Nocardia]